MSGVCLFGSRHFFRLCQRQADGEAASLARLAFHRDIPFQQLYRVGYDGKSQPEAVLRHGVAQPLKRDEYPRLLFSGHARAGVFHRQGKYAVLVAGA